MILLEWMISLNHCYFWHSSRNRPLKLSIKPLFVGWLGWIKINPTPSLTQYAASEFRILNGSYRNRIASKQRNTSRIRVTWTPEIPNVGKNVRHSFMKSSTQVRHWSDIGDRWPARPLRNPLTRSYRVPPGGAAADASMPGLYDAVTARIQSYFLRQV